MWLLRYWRERSVRTRWLAGLWLFFLLLVLLGAHGSSITHTTIDWSPEDRFAGYTHYLFEPLVKVATAPVGGKTGEIPRFLGSMPRAIRADEWLISTPWALSQCAHEPRFPVVNTNIGLGQNMLLIYNAPVLHPAMAARPATWGYMLFGAERGLAWQWWFGVFACFTVLTLLFEAVLKGQSALAAFGAFWFCGSAYVVCWSLTPAYVTFFPALGCLALYHLLHSSQPRTHWLCGVLLGLSLPGFVMFLYPPWQVALGYFFLCLFLGLLWRDRLCTASWTRSRIGGAGVSVVLAAGLLGAFLWDAMPAIKAMSETVYPGHREDLGGSYTFVDLFKGFYNFWTIYGTPRQLLNESESASAFLFFPAVWIGMACSGRLRRQTGAIGWLLSAFMVVLLGYMMIGFSPALARCTVFSYCVPTRCDAAVCLASITLCLLLLGGALDGNRSEDRTGKAWERLFPMLAGAAIFLMLAGHGVVLVKKTALDVSVAFAVALAGGFLSYCLLAGRREIFCTLTALAVICTTATFNPLGRGLGALYNSEMARTVKRLNTEAGGGKVLWVCYGPSLPGSLVYTVGGHSLAGSHFYPQMELWRRLAPGNPAAEACNRYAGVSFQWSGGAPDQTSFLVYADRISVDLSPFNPVLKQLGAKYVLAMGETQAHLERANLPVRYKSPEGHFTVFDAP